MRIFERKKLRIIYKQIGSLKYIVNCTIRKDRYVYAIGFFSIEMELTMEKVRERKKFSLHFGAAETVIYNIYSSFVTCTVDKNQGMSLLKFDNLKMNEIR